VCSEFLCCVCGLIHLSSWLFLWFVICGLVHVLFLSLVLNFSISILPVTTLGLDLFSVHIITSYCVYGAQWLRFTQSEGSTRLHAPLPENGNSLKIRQLTKSQKRLCQLISVGLWPRFWISWPLNMGPTDCPEMLVRNYHILYAVQDIESRSYMTVWWCRPWFGLAWFGSGWSSLAQSSSVFPMRIKTTSHI